MGKGKPRHNPNKPANLYARLGNCAYNDDTVWKECGYPWADKCIGNLYTCYKLRLQHIATLSPAKREAFLRKHPDVETPHTNLSSVMVK